MPASSVSVHMDGHALDGLAKQVGYVIALQKGERIAERAKALCPVRTGYLRSTIGWRVNSPFDPTLTVYATAYYASYVHDGTRRMRARPFLLDAMNAEREG